MHASTTLSVSSMMGQKSHDIASLTTKAVASIDTYQATQTEQTRQDALASAISLVRALETPADAIYKLFTSVWTNSQSSICLLLIIFGIYSPLFLWLWRLPVIWISSLFYPTGRPQPLGKSWPGRKTQIFNLLVGCHINLNLLVVQINLFGRTYYACSCLLWFR